MAEPLPAAPPNGGALIPDFAWPPGVRAAVTTSGMPGVSPSPFERCNLGARCGDAPANVAVNRLALRATLRLPSEPVWLRQVHGTAVQVLDLPGDPNREAHDDPVADAAYADRPGLICVVQTADCLPLLIASDDGGEVAAVHAGWRGLAAGVIEATLARFRAPPQRLRVWLGPAIAARSYEVGEEVRAAFIAADAGAAEAFTPTRPGHWLCDLYALARRRLRAAGVATIGGGGLDTYTDPRFYSHRRARPTGRFASLIWIEPAAQPRHHSRLVFPRLLGTAFVRLPQTVQTLHLARGLRRYRGRVTIRRGGNWLARLCAFVTGMPPAMTDAPLSVDIAAAARGEQWTRDFDGHRMRSRLWRRNGRLCERLGPVTFGFALQVLNGVLQWRVDSVRALGIRLPARWFRRVRAREWEADGRYYFEVTAALPLAGDLVHYAGWLDVDAARSFTPPADDDDDRDEDLDGPDDDDDGDAPDSVHHDAGDHGSDGGFDADD